MRYFLAVVDQGNFTRAAAACNVSQPTLSVGIRNLERALGAKLFQRNAQRVRLTDAGTKLLTHARRIEAEFNEARQSISGASEAALIRVGVLRSIPGSALATIVAHSMASDPAERIEVLEGSERELLAHLSRGRIDCAFSLVDRGGERFLEEPLYREGYRLVLPSNHAFASKQGIAAEEVGNEVMILRPHCEALSETSRHFTERGVRPHFAFRSTNDERVMAMVAAGLGVTVMPEGYRREGVASVALAGFDMTRMIGLLYATQGEALATSPPPFIAAIRAFARQAA